MAMVFARIRLVAAAIAFLILAAVATPVAAQQPNSVDPNADAVKEQQLLDQFKTHPGSRHHPGYQVLRHRTAAGPAVAAVPRGVRCTGSAASPCSACSLCCVIFYLVRGMVRIKAGRSGRQDRALQPPSSALCTG